MRNVWMVLILFLLAGCTTPSEELSSNPNPAPDAPTATYAPPPSSAPPTATEDPPSSSTESQQSSEPEPEPATPIVHHLSRHWDQETTSWLLGPSDNKRLDFVPRNGSALVLELWWNDASQDLDPALIAADDCYDGGGLVGVGLCGVASVTFTGDYSGTWWLQDGHPGAGDVGARIEVSAETVAQFRCGENCTWRAYAYAKDIARDVTWNLYVTDFPDGVIPEDYSSHEVELPAGSA